MSRMQAAPIPGSQHTGPSGPAQSRSPYDWSGPLLGYDIWEGPRNLPVSARCWAIGMGWWGIAWFVLWFPAGLHLLHQGNRGAGAVAIIWSLSYGVSALTMFYRPGPGALVQALQASTCLVSIFLGSGWADGIVKVHRLWPLAVLLSVSAAVSLFGMKRLSRAYGAGNLLLSIWALALCVPVASGLLSRSNHAHAVAVGTAAIAACLLLPAGDRGIRLPAHAGRSLMLLALLAAVFVPAAWLYVRGLRWCMGPSSGAAVGTLEAALIVVVIPALTEVLFRGVIQGSLTPAWGRALSIAGTAALFAIVHLSPEMLPWWTLLGTALGYLRERTGSLVPGFLLYSGCNVIMFLIPVH